MPKKIAKLSKFHCAKCGKTLEAIFICTVCSDSVKVDLQCT